MYSCSSSWLIPTIEQQNFVIHWEELEVGTAAKLGQHAVARARKRECQKKCWYRVIELKINIHNVQKYFSWIALTHASINRVLHKKYCSKESFCNTSMIFFQRVHVLGSCIL